MEFLERQGASAAVGGEIGRERGDAFEEGLGAGVEIEWRLLLLGLSGRFDKMRARNRVVRVSAWAGRVLLKRLILGATEASGGLLSLGGVMIPWVGIRLFLGGFSVSVG